MARDRALPACDECHFSVTGGINPQSLQHEGTNLLQPLSQVRERRPQIVRNITGDLRDAMVAYICRPKTVRRRSANAVLSTFDIALPLPMPRYRSAISREFKSSLAEPASAM